MILISIAYQYSYPQLKKIASSYIISPVSFFLSVYGYLESIRLMWESLTLTIFFLSHSDQLKRFTGISLSGVCIVRHNPFAIVVQSLSHVQLFATAWTIAHQASLSFTISWSLLKLTSIKLVMPSKHLVSCYSLLFLPSIIPSTRVFF